MKRDDSATQALDALAGLIGQASPAPWHHEEQEDGQPTGTVRTSTGGYVIGECDSVPEGCDDADAIVALFNLAPALVEVARAADGLLREFDWLVEVGKVVGFEQSRDALRNAIAALGGAK